MKKAISLAAAIILVFSCITTAFAAQTATPDEATKVKSLSITKLPDKLEYLFPDDIITLIDGKPAENFEIIDLTEDEVLDAISKAVMNIKINMDGAEITAEYFDGTKAQIDPKDCDVKVTNPLRGAEFVDIMKAYQDELIKLGFSEDTEPTEEQMNAFFEVFKKYAAEVNALFGRDINVEVSYGGASTDFSVKLKLNELPAPQFGDYEFVSYEETKPKTYYLSRDFEEFDAGDGSKEYVLNFDTSDIKVTARNTETGEEVVYSGDDIMLYYHYFSDDGASKSGEYTASGSVYDDERGCYVEFEYKFNIVNDLEKEKKPAPATKDEATPAQPVSNGAVQTGAEINYILPLLIVLLSVAAVYVSYKKKEIK